MLSRSPCRARLRSPERHVTPASYDADVWHDAALDPAGTGFVGNLDDFSGNGRSPGAGGGETPFLTDTSGSQAPNGNRYYQFDGSDDHLEYSSSNDWGSKVDEGTRVIGAFRKPTSSTNGVVISKRDPGSAGNDSGWELRYNSDNANMRFAYEGDGGANGVDSFGYAVANFGSWHVVNFKRTNIGNSNALLRENGSAATESVNSDTLTTNASVATQNAEVGAERNGAVEFDGQLLCLAGWWEGISGNGDPGDEAAYRLERWLGHRIGVEV